MISANASESAIDTALGNFLASILPSEFEIVVGEVNRVPEARSPDFAVMWPLRRPRLATNISRSQDTKFAGSIDETVMTVTAVEKGKLAVGQTIFGIGVAAVTTIASLGTGTGGVGTYNIAPAQLVSAGMLSAGQKKIEQPTEAVYQVDVHGPASSDNSQIIANLWRDGFAVKQLKGKGVTPLYAEDPRQVPFENGAKQIEVRWVIDLHMQIYPSVLVPQQYADEANVMIVAGSNLPAN